jgi:membrane-associated protease RseP (regulator of RpoE activity)
MITDHNLADLDKLVAAHFSIDDVTYGDPKQPFVVRYRGKINSSDISKEFDQLIEKLSAHQLMPMLRKEEDRQVLFLVPEIQKKRMLNPNFNLALFIITLISVMITGGMYGFQGEPPQDFFQLIWELIQNGWPFAVSLLAILGTHEFGHYFAGRRHGVQVTLPYFIPFPFSIFGTMGAFINMRSLPKNRKALFDLSITGPLSGLVASIVVLLIGLSLSELNQLPLAPASGSAFQMEGNSLLYLFLKFISFGKLLPQPPDLSGIALASHWVRYFFTGQPFPWGATDVMLHPVAWAGWAGLLVTGINLIPAGQLDGGHIFFTLFGKKTTQKTFPVIVGLLVAMGFVWAIWWIWAALIYFLGRSHAEPLDMVTDLDAKRRWLGYFALIIFLLVFVPVPIMLVTF